MTTGYLEIGPADVAGYVQGTLRSERTGRPLTAHGRPARTCLYPTERGMEHVERQIHETAVLWHRWTVTRVVVREAQS
ncbi:MAG: hypothetical protein IPK80_02870 [Nannocystis sp.]|nr:hypothetical protein [Nannocystis sp.]